jgi:hypothetical protein
MKTTTEVLLDRITSVRNGVAELLDRSSMSQMERDWEQEDRSRVPARLSHRKRPDDPRHRVACLAELVGNWSVSLD